MTNILTHVAHILQAPAYISLTTEYFYWEQNKQTKLCVERCILISDKTIAGIMYDKLQLGMTIHSGSQGTTTMGLFKGTSIDYFIGPGSNLPDWTT